ncbi:ribonuclease VapC [Betaproteobacteria bacterium]|nr:ribonuclease VapC [Betaproteobacteria bacterium]GHU39838.1 ribonuclease VapC [Betaproteobacteria bacterium]
MMILDTNVLSETLRPTPDHRVLEWMGEQSRAALFSTTLTRAELLYGVHLLAAGQRKNALLEAVLAIFTTDLAGQILDFDNDAADAYAEIAATRKAAGKPIRQFDAMIAGIAQSRGATLVTRNTKDFLDIDVQMINPWNA